MKLIDLEPEFLRYEGGTGHRIVDSLNQANGLLFLCPLCFAKNKGNVGTHSVITWFKGVPLSIDPKPGRWTVSGTSLNDLTLSPSVHLSGPGCGWHGFIQNGEIK